jgi:hypothetical protein
MAQVKLTTDKGSMAQRVADRLKPSAGQGAGDVQVTHGSSPNRTITTIHHAAGHVKTRDVRNVDIRSASKQKPPGGRQ